MEDVVAPEKCPICGVQMRAAANGSQARNFSPSLDRIVPALGYTPENIVIICNACNRKKDNMSPEELYAIADFFYILRKTRGLDETKK